MFKKFESVIALGLIQSLAEARFFSGSHVASDEATDGDVTRIASDSGRISM